MTYAAAFLAIVGFAIGLRVSGAVPAAAKAVTVGRSAAKCMTDPSLEDSDREHALQEASVALLVSFLSILARGAAALALSAIPLLIFEYLGLARTSEVTTLLLGWKAILASSLLLAALSVRWTRP